MSTNDLDRLDERGRAAAADLQQRAADRPRPTFDPIARSGLEAPVPLASRRRRASDPRWLAAAAVVVVALVGAVVWATGSGGDDDSPTDVTTTEIRPWRPTVLPEGLELAGAGEVDRSEAVVGVAAPLTLYGSSVDEPRLGLTWFDGDTISLADGGRTIEVDGREVTVLDTQGLLAPSVAVPSTTDDGWIAAIGSSLDEDELARIAVQATGGADGVSIDEAVLPDGWSRLGEDPQGLFGASTVSTMRADASVPLRSSIYAVPGADGSSSSSGSSSGSDEEAPEPLLPERSPMITVTSSRGDELALSAVRLTAAEVEEVTVRGHRALLTSMEAGDVSDDPGVRLSTTSVSWLEAPGELLSVSGFDLDREAVLAAAESIEVVPAAEWRDLVERSQLGDLPGSSDEGEERVEIGRGELADGTGWILRRSGDEDGTLSLQVALGGDSSSSSIGYGAAPGGDPADPPGLRWLEVQEVEGRRVLAGQVGRAVASVELRDEAGTVVERADLTAFADAALGSWFVLEAPSAATDLVVLDASGSELQTEGLAEIGTGGGPSREELEGGEEPTVSVETTVPG